MGESGQGSWIGVGNRKCPLFIFSAKKTFFFFLFVFHLLNTDTAVLLDYLLHHLPLFPYWIYSFVFFCPTEFSFFFILFFICLTISPFHLLTIQYYSEFIYTTILIPLLKISSSFEYMQKVQTFFKKMTQDQNFNSI